MSDAGSPAGSADVPRKGDGLYLKAHREWQGLTQEELGRLAWPALSNPKSRISKYETGRANIGLAEMRRLAEVLGIRTGLLFWPPKQIFRHPGALNQMKKTG